MRAIRLGSVLGVVVSTTLAAGVSARAQPAADRPGDSEERRGRISAEHRERVREKLTVLTSGTVGAGPHSVSGAGDFDLSIEADFDLGGVVFKDGRPLLHTDGGFDYGNVALGPDALIQVTPGVPSPTSGANNVAVGKNALLSTTSGRDNVAIGSNALVYNDVGFGNVAVGAQALYDNQSGIDNVAVGFLALRSNLTGITNVAVGFAALNNNTAGNDNTAVGYFSALSNMTGSRNTALGYGALSSNSSGDENTAVGIGALYVAYGSHNTAVGANALVRAALGERNTAVGYRAGFDLEDGSDNIYLGSGAVGTATESNTIRIGGRSGAGNGLQNRTFVAGVRGASLPGAGQAVCVAQNEQLGPCSLSSRRFKEGIRDMARESAGLDTLRPVVFRYRPEIAGAEPQREFGLVAEEVAEVYPELVTYDDAGRPVTVRYHALVPMLLNELQRQRLELDELAARLDARDRRGSDASSP